MNFRQPNEDLFDNTRMSFGEHLEELRKVLFQCLIWIAIGCAGGFLMANQVVRILKQPLVEAMGDYNLAEAAAELTARDGYVAPELVPWLEKEKFLPRRMRVDPADLVAALQSVVPDFATTIQLEPYSFHANSFSVDQLPQLCLQLSRFAQAQPVESDKTKSDRPDSETARTKLIWDLLSPNERQTITGLATQSTADFQDANTIADIFNRISKESELYEAPEFAAEVTNEESGLASWLGEVKIKPLAMMKTKLDEKNDTNLARRLNRALISNVFSAHMPELKMDLVPIEFWETAEFEPQSLGVSETFMVWVKAGVLTGLIFSFPFIFYHLWSFVAAGLYPHEQKYVHIFLPISIGLFLSGVLLAFLFVFQPVLGFLFSFNRQMGIAPQMRINDWLSFVMFLPLGFGLAFQLPLVMLFMNRIGLFQVADYLNKWRIAVMIIFVLAMVLTPADPISMLLLAIPLTLLYFMGIGMCQWMPQNKNPFGESERKYTT